MSFLSWNQFCYSSLLCEFRIDHFLTAFCGNFYNFWALLAWVWLLSTCAELYISCVIVIDDLENFISIAFSVENFPMLSKDDKIDLLSVVVTDLKKSLKKLFQESTLSPYNYDFPERFVQQCYLHFFFAYSQARSWPRQGFPYLMLSVKIGNFLYKSCLFPILLTCQLFSISRQNLHICIFVAYTLSDFDQIAVKVIVSEILMQ